MSSYWRSFVQRNFPIIILIIFLVLVTRSFISGPNDGSRFATVRALVENHTFSIDSHDSIDIVQYNGRFYSSKPPLLSVIAAGIYWPLHTIFHIEIPTLSPEPSIAIYIIDLVIVGGSLALLVVFFYKSLAFFSFSSRWRFWITMALVFSTLIFSYSGSLNSHIPAAAFLFMGFYFFLKQFKEDVTAARSLFIGFLLSAAFSIEPIVSGFFVMMMFFYQVYDRRFRKTIVYFIVGFLPLTIIYALIQQFTIGTPLPPYFDKSLYYFAGAYWLHPIGIDALHQPKWLYLFHLLFGTHGLFLYTPILLVVFHSVYRMWKNPEYNYLRVFSVFIFSAIVFYILFITFTTNNFGGISYGTRWFIGFIPILFFFVAFSLNDFFKKHFTLAFFLLALSVFFAFFGFTGPWSDNAFMANGTPYFFPLLTKFLMLSR